MVDVHKIILMVCFQMELNMFEHVFQEPSKTLPHVVDKRIFVCAIDQYIIDV